jgi:hypothetical protein
MDAHHAECADCTKFFYQAVEIPAGFRSIPAGAARQKKRDGEFAILYEGKRLP